MAIDEKCLVSQVPFIAIDTETCGLYESRIVELAAVRFCGGEEFGRFQTLVNPEESIPSDATAVHGITDDMVEDAPKIREALTAFVNFAGKGAIWIAHNSPFDVKILATEFFRCDLPIPEGYVLDSCRLSRRFNRELKSHSLGSVCSHLGVAQEHAHRALGDSADVMRIVTCMLEDFPNMTYGELLSKHGKPYDFNRAIETSLFIPSDYREMDSYVS